VHLTDREQIEQLLARYAERIDAGDFDGVASLLAHATLRMEDGTAIAHGTDEIRALYEATTRRHDDGTPKTMHVITNLIVEPLADGRIEARSRFTVLQATGDVPLQPIVAGRYRDIVEPDGEGGWRFAERTMAPYLIGDVHDHLTIDL
jgi:3-phenylpropionate/cinnamic acid dioxygenase small subunit